MMTSDMKRVNWEAIIAIGSVLTIVATNYLFTENVRLDLKMDIQKGDDRWYTLLQVIHSQDKRILTLEIEK